MAKKYKYKFLTKELGQITNTFAENGVTLSFDERDEYVTALEKIAPIIYESYDRYLKFIESKERD
jgi:hypothetical protein